MTTKEYKWHVNLVRDRYNHLDLTFEQAEKVYQFEQDKYDPSGKYYFSEWEEWDYELTAFAEILNADQLQKHKALLNETINRYEQDLIEDDSKKTNDLLYLRELIDFYESRFLPDIFKNAFMGMGWLINEKSKVQYLKTEYKHFLHDLRKQTLTDHFRHYRTFKPNELKVALLRNKLYNYLPDYHHFKFHMDEPTKAVAHYLTKKRTYIPEEIEQLLQKKYDELKAFNIANHKKHYGEIKGGFHITIGLQTEDEEREYRFMALLLLDKKKYSD